MVMEGQVKKESVTLSVSLSLYLSIYHLLIYLYISLYLSIYPSRVSKVYTDSVEGQVSRVWDSATLTDSLRIPPDGQVQDRMGGCILS